MNIFNFCKQKLNFTINTSAVNKNRLKFGAKNDTLLRDKTFAVTEYM